MEIVNLKHKHQIERYSFIGTAVERSPVFCQLSIFRHVAVLTSYTERMHHVNTCTHVSQSATHLAESETGKLKHKKKPNMLF